MPATDPFKHLSAGLESPPTRHFEITPADVDLDVIPRCIRVGGDGDLVIKDRDDVVITYSVLAGEMFVFMPKQVMAATTATGLVGLY